MKRCKPIEWPYADADQQDDLVPDVPLMAALVAVVWWLRWGILAGVAVVGVIKLVFWLAWMMATGNANIAAANAEVTRIKTLLQEWKDAWESDRLDCYNLCKRTDKELGDE
jgi:hypothetical protein